MSATDQTHVSCSPAAPPTGLGKRFGILPLGRRIRFHARLLPVSLVIALAVIAVAALSIDSLRSGAASRRHNARLADAVLLDLARGESVSWQALAEGGPDATFQRLVMRLDASLAAEAAQLGRTLVGTSAAARVVFLIGFFRTGLVSEQRQLAARQVSAAADTATNAVTGTLDLLRGPLRESSYRLRTEGDAAERRADRWSLGILGITTVVILLLGFAVNRARLVRAQAEREVQGRSERRLGALVQNAADVILVIDESGRITFATVASRRVLGHSPEELVGRRVAELAPEDQAHRLTAALARPAGPGHAPVEVELPVCHADGRLLWTELVLAKRLEEPDLAATVMTLRDVTERHEMQERLRHQAFHDALTGLANRALFEDRVEHALDRVRTRGGRISVAFIDLDDFKTVNDSLGHSAGDRLLRAVASRIHACLRASDTAARLGGDEFAVLFDGSEEHDVLRITQRLLHAVAITSEVAGREVLVNASIGIAHSRAETLCADDLVRDADIALYASKAAGKGLITQFKPEMLDAARRRLDLREDLRGAIEREELELAYQPLVDLQTGQGVQVEALLRWRHPEHGVVSPDAFIPIADETGLIVPIGRWVLDRACRDLRALHQSGFPGLRMNVNVSAVQLGSGTLLTDVRGALARHLIQGHQLVLELTESALLSDERATDRTLQAIRGLGVWLAVDDFGTGYASLSYVQRLALDSVKIDRSFVTGVGGGGQNDTLVLALIELGHTLGLTVVAEGVETPQQRDRLVADGCDVAQGFLYSRPVPFAELPSTLGRLAGGSDVAALS